MNFTKVFNYRLALPLLLAVIVMLGGTFTTYAQINDGEFQRYTGVDRIFKHSQKRFEVLVPGNAILVSDEAGLDVSMRSREGWSVTIQSAFANPQKTVGQMIGGLESQYLGAGKLWARKLSGDEVRIGGYLGYDGFYEGSGMKVRVLLLRTSDLDFVIMFVTPDDAYLDALQAFDQILLSFKPATLNAEADSGPVVERPKMAESENVDGLVRYHDIQLGYSMVYPSLWEISHPNQTTTVFSGSAGTDTAYAAVTVQNVSRIVNGSAKMSVDSVFQELKAQMAYSLADIRHTPGKSFELTSGGVPVQVFQFVSDYRRGETSSRQWTLAIPRPDSNIVHVWIFTAPYDRFDAFQSIAQQMAGSIAVEDVLR